MPSFVKFVRTSPAQRYGILAAITHGLSNQQPRRRAKQLNTRSG